MQRNIASRGSHSRISRLLRRRPPSSGPLRARGVLSLTALVLLGGFGLAVSDLAASSAGATRTGTTSVAVPGPPPALTGRIAFASDRSGNNEIYMMNADRTGAPKNLTHDAADDLTPALSRDGRRIAFTSYRNGRGDIYTMNDDGSALTNRTPNAFEDFDPALSADGKTIAFASYRGDGGSEIYVMDTGGAKPPWRITDEEPGVDASQPTFSSDGQWIAYTVGYADGGGRDIYRIRADDSGERERLTEDGSNSDPAYSPDGGQIVFSSWRDHDAEIYAMAADGDGEHNLTEFPDGQDEEPAFSPDGRRIAFSSDRDDDPSDEMTQREVYAMNADGQLQTNLTRLASADDASPSWGQSPPCKPGLNQIAVYEHPSYQGRCVVRGVGTYNNRLDFVPLGDETASSIRVGGDARVRLARDSNFTGQVETFTADDADLTDNAVGNDTMSSFKVEPRKAAVKVMVVVIDPILASRGGQRLSTFMGWQNPDDLTTRFIDDLRTASHGTADYKIAKRVDIDKWPLHKNGQRYTDDLYLWDYNNDRDHWLLGDGDYSALIKANNIAQEVQRGNVDEVFIWGYPGDGFAESTMAGRNAFYINGDPITDVPTNPFVLMGFNYERGLAEAAESYGHRVEFMMERVYGRWNPIEGNDWERFTVLDRDLPGRGGIGNAHNAFNAPPCASRCDPRAGYDRDSQRTVSTSADDWYNFPNMTGARTTKNCSAWGCCPVTCDSAYQYLKWWYDHMPHVTGTKSGVLNDWWYYILDPSTVLGFRT
jgi:Tol biopolymer transport system component